MALEMLGEDEGTMVYSPNNLEGEALQGISLWKFDD